MVEQAVPSPDAHHPLTEIPSAAYVDGLPVVAPVPDEGYDLAQVIEVASAGRTFSIARADKSSEWFLAIAVALNAGAVATLFSSMDKITYESTDYICFLLGLGAVLASSALAGFLAHVSSDNFADLFNAVLQVQNEKSGDHTPIEAAYQKLGHGSIVRNAPMFLRFVSVALFFVGVINLYFSLPHRLEPASRRCLAIQNDMLARQPRRLDSRELFTALGCHPQGEGVMQLLPSSTGRDRVKPT